MNSEQLKNKSIILSFYYSSAIYETGYKYRNTRNIYCANLLANSLRFSASYYDFECRSL